MRVELLAVVPGSSYSVNTVPADIHNRIAVNWLVPLLWHAQMGSQNSTPEKHGRAKRVSEPPAGGDFIRGHRQQLPKKEAERCRTYAGDSAHEPSPYTIQHIADHNGSHHQRGEHVQGSSSPSQRALGSTPDRERYVTSTIQHSQGLKSQFHLQSAAVCSSASQTAAHCTAMITCHSLLMS